MVYPLQQAFDEIVGWLKDTISVSDVAIKLEVPPDPKMGDVAFPCFGLAPKLKQSPQHIAMGIKDKFSGGTWVASVEAHGGYVNFFLDTNRIVSATLDSVLSLGERYGFLRQQYKQVIIEHTSANPNGPFHVGRARNPIIGDTLVRLFRAAGFDVDAQFYVDDMGKQVAILAWGISHLSEDNMSTVSHEKPDHRFVGFYQRANELMQEDAEVDKEIKELIKKSEEGDAVVLEQIHQAYRPVLDGMLESLSRLHVKIDTFVPESRFVLDKQVEVVIEKLRKSDFADQEDQAWFLDLASFGVKGRNTKFFFQRRDGTSLYATRDIAYHMWKATQADRLINVLGEDHKLEAKQVAIALGLLDVPVIPEPVFYSFVSLPGGKMSTRKGRAVYLDDLIQESVSRAYNEVKKRRGAELDTAKMQAIAEMVGVGAIRYNIIKVQPEKDIVFKWEEALNFEGDSIPFIQYAHARAASILRKTSVPQKLGDVSNLTHDSEILLMKHLARLPQIIADACAGCKPHTMAQYVYETAALFNQFYRDCPVLSCSDPQLTHVRLQVVHATKIVLANSLSLLGIAAPEEM